MERDRQSTIRVLIVDDHQVVRRGLRAYLSLESDIEVVGEAQDGESAVAEFARVRPDITLLDLHMVPVDGVEALRRIRRNDEQARVIVLTSFIDAAHVLPAMEAGAAGYLLKTSDPNEIAAAIRGAFAGRATYDAEAMQAMAKGMRARATMSLLTERELDVLRLLARGKSNQEIGDELFIGLKTVKTHVSNILAKLEVTDRTQAAVYALTHGLTQEA